MTPGRTFIRKCSRCSKQISQRTVKSGNTFGAIWWTDGWYRAAMLPDQPRLVACPHCHATLWIDELEKLGVLDDATRRAGKFAEVLPYLSLSHEDYLVLISEGVATCEKERYARRRAWWAGNDRRRGGVAEIPLTPTKASNLTAVG